MRIVIVIVYFFKRKFYFSIGNVWWAAACGNVRRFVLTAIKKGQHKGRPVRSHAD